MIISKIFKLFLFTILAFSVGISKAAENQFFVFPVQAIEGLGATNGEVYRPLVDERAVAFIKGDNADAQKEIRTHFATQLGQAYAGSIVHAKQVKEALKGPVSYVDADNISCGDTSSTVTLDQTYAAVIGISRASFYEVIRAGNTEILIPITLNLQIIKVDKAKILFSSSNTVYSQFMVNSAEIGTPEYNKLIRDKITQNIKDQVTNLVQEAKINFSPKITPVKMVGKDGNLFVADKGFEVGFSEGDFPVATDINGKSLMFKVLTAADGYTVLQPQGPQAGDVKLGQQYNFIFEVKADDSNKPRVMPVTSDKKEKAILNGVIDIFSKSIGYKAPFQVSTVDVNFQQTMGSIRREALCVPWDKYPEALQVEENRTDYPQFILTVDAGETAGFVAKGDGGVKTKETFATIVQAKVSDFNGVVYGSALGVDKYVLDKTADIGLSSANAKQVSYQNSTKAMVADFLKNVNFEPKVFKVKSVNSGNLMVENLPVESGYKIEATVVRKLSVKVGKKDVFVKLPVSVKSQVNKKGSDAEISYSLNNIEDSSFNPKAGDSLVVFALPKGNAKIIGLCDGEIAPKSNATSSTFAKPLLTNFIYNLPNYQVVSVNNDLASDVNRLLKTGKFILSDDRKMKVDSQPSSCLQTGYLIKEEQASCDGGNCKASVLNALLIRLVDSGQTKKDYVSARKSQLAGFEPSQKENFYSLSSHEQFMAGLPELSKKVNEK
jgi:hypothetical protein